jgi:hypothetical protein
MAEGPEHQELESLVAKVAETILQELG